MIEQSIEGNIRNMVRVQGGDFLMGATPEQETEALDSKKPVHPATVGDFMICRYPVTQGEWEAVMGGNPSDFKGDPSLPVETVSHDDAIAFINRLNAMTTMASACPRRRNGSMRPAEALFQKGSATAGATTLTKWRGRAETVGEGPIPSAFSNPTNSASTTCLAMFGNGAWTLVGIWHTAFAKSADTALSEPSRVTRRQLDRRSHVCMCFFTQR
jgi:hypothetical protein